MLKFSKKRIFLLAIAFGMRYTPAQKQRSSCRFPSREETQPLTRNHTFSTYYTYMKLHLPKMLLTAVLAACVASAYAESEVVQWQTPEFGGTEFKWTGGAGTQDYATAENCISFEIIQAVIYGNDKRSFFFNKIINACFVF